MKKNYRVVERGKYGQPISEVIREHLRDPEYRRGFLRDYVRLEIAAVVKDFRLSKGMTQKQLAARARVPQSQIARLESLADDRIPSLDFIIKLIAALGGSVDLVMRPSARAGRRAREIALA